MNHAKDLIKAFVEHYRPGSHAPRHYAPRMAQDIADSYAWISPAYKVALFEEVTRTFTPTQMRPLPDMAALAAAEKQLPPPDVLEDRSETKALPGPDDGQLPNTCPFCGHPVKRFSKTEAICLGDYDDRIDRKTGCGAEWELVGEGWRQGYRTNGKWHDGPPGNLNFGWRDELATGAPPMDLAAMINDGIEKARARRQVRIDRGIASEDEKRWHEESQRPKPNVPGVKHVSEVGVSDFEDDPFV
jgi:hypothetical protein